MKIWSAICLLGRAFNVELHKAGKTCRIHWSQDAYGIFQNKIRDDDLTDIDRLIVLLYRHIELQLPFQTHYRKRTKYSPQLVKSDVCKLNVQFRPMLQRDFRGSVPLYNSIVSALKFEGKMHRVAFR